MRVSGTNTRTNRSFVSEMVASVLPGLAFWPALAATAETTPALRRGHGSVGQLHLRQLHGRARLRESGLGRLDLGFGAVVLGLGHAGLGGIDSGECLRELQLKRALVQRRNHRARLYAVTLTHRDGLDASCHRGGDLVLGLLDGAARSERPVRGDLLGAPPPVAEPTGHQQEHDHQYRHRRPLALFVRHIASPSPIFRRASFPQGRCCVSLADKPHVDRRTRRQHWLICGVIESRFDADCSRQVDVACRE